MINMIKLEVDGYAVAVKVGSTVRQAADALGIELPRFCYHERLRVAGNCRMCLVEVVGSPKPVASCAIPANNGMKVFTSSPLVKKAREAVMELLRANHPLDCPICDQGGECDLQDQSIRYGSDRTRMYEPKRGVEDKYLGPLVKIVITRCIHCTRCIRFASEVAGVGLLGTSGRGSDTEVGTYIERAIESELSGNRVDRCPVGALTSKPTAFKKRPWELDSIDSYDDTDGLMPSIRVQINGNVIHRIIPRNNDEVNGQWLGDKGRYIVDAYSKTRIKCITVSRKKDLFEVVSSMSRGIELVTNVIDKMSRTLMLVTQSIDVGSLEVIKRISNMIPATYSTITIGYSNKVIRSGFKSEYMSTSELTNRNSTDVALLIGTDLRKESPVVNTIMRNGYINGANVISFGSQIRETYPVESISLHDIVIAYNGVSNSMLNIMKSNNVSVVFGTSVMQRDTAIVLMSAVHDIMYYIILEGGIDIKNIVVHTRANTVGSMILGMPGYNSELDYKDYISVLNIGVMTNDIIEQGINIVYYDNIDKQYNMMFASWIEEKILVYHKAIIPRMRNHEQESIIVNTEGRYCLMKKAITSSRMLESGSVNAAVLSMIFKDGKGYYGEGGGYYNKRINMLSYLYEAIDNDCDVLNVPAVHDYYLEGHSGLLSSDKMVECSKMYTKSTTYSEF